MLGWDCVARAADQKLAPGATGGLCRGAGHALRFPSRAAQAARVLPSRRNPSASNVLFYQQKHQNTCFLLIRDTKSQGSTRAIPTRCPPNPSHQEAAPAPSPACFCAVPKATQRALKLHESPGHPKHNCTSAPCSSLLGKLAGKAVPQQQDRHLHPTRR